MNIFYQPELPDMNYLDPEESKHCIKVLRKAAGDKISIIDGKGNLYQAIITNPSHKQCGFEVTAIEMQIPFPVYRHIAIAPTKNNDRIEWFVEKAVEIGVDEISFIKCAHSERTNLKLERVEKKVISAMKQSLKLFKPKVNQVQNLSKFLESDFPHYYKAIAIVDFENPKQFKNQIGKHNKNLILIGPEGDFSESEVSEAISQGFEKVSLGNSRLRTETAGIVSSHIMTLFNE